MLSPLLTYAAETRSDILKTMKILEAAEVKILRKILNLTLLDRETNDVIKERCVVQKINDSVQRRRDEWQAKVERMIT